MSISEDNISSKNPRTMNVEPHWPSMFALAIEVVSKQRDKEATEHAIKQASKQT